LIRKQLHVAASLYAAGFMGRLETSKASHNSDEP
jgi:hypothetical protein